MKTIQPVQYLALLRGINVGGNNVIKMAELKALFESAGFTGVTTYIQSGNIIFFSNCGGREQTAEIIETLLQQRLGNKIISALLTPNEMQAVIDGKPAGFGEDTETYKYDVIFLIDPLTGADAVQKIKTRDGVDTVYAGDKVVYISRLISSITKSYLSKITESPIYQNITIRNWNTTQKLCALLVGDNHPKR